VGHHGEQGSEARLNEEAAARKEDGQNSPAIFRQGRADR